MRGKKPQLFIFLFTAVIVILVARMWYVGLSATPSGTGDASGTATGTIPPHLVLGPTSASSSLGTPAALASTDPAGTDGSSATSATPSAPYYGEPNTADSVFTRIATTTVPNFEREAILVRDITNGVDLADINENVRWPTASLTKLMTATVVLDHLSMDTKITITPQMMAVDPEEGHLVVDGTYTVYDLLHVMLMPSSNVAAEALADYYGRSQFLAAMNQRAAEWGMTDTYFNDPSGLSSANESTAHDLAILATHVYESYPTILQFTDTPDIVITNFANNTNVDVRSINQFAGDANFIGGKTGYIPEARDNLLSMFRYGGKPVLIIVLGAGDTAERFSDTTKLLDWFTMNYK